MDQYTAATEQLDRTRETIKVKKNALQETMNEFKKKKSKYDEIVRLKDWADEEHRLSQEYVVALGDDKLKEIEVVEAEVMKKKESEDKTKAKLDELSAENSVIQKKKLECELKLESEREKYAAQEMDLGSQKLAIDQLKEEEKKYVKEIKGLENMKKTVEGEIRIFEEQISSLNSAGSARERKQREKQRLSDLAEVDEKMAEINENIQSLGIERDSIDKNTEQNRKELDHVEYERKATVTKIGNLEKELNDMKNFGHQQLATFDTLAPKVSEQIRQAEMQDKFNIRPIGPVGSFIKLSQEAVSNPDLARLIETEIGGPILRCYLCNSDADRRVLWDIFSRVYGNKKKPNIFTSKFLNQKHKVQRVQGHKTVMDFLEIDGNPQEEVVVFNHLVDQRSIETVVVTKTQDEAKKLCTYINSVPRNLNYCITQDYNKFFPPSKNTSYRSYFIEPVHSQVLGSNMNVKIAEKKRDIEKNKTDLQLVEEKKKNLERKKDKMRHDHDVIHAQITTHQKSLTNFNIKKSKLRAEEDPAENSNSVAEKLDKKKLERTSIMKQQEEKIDKKKKVVNQAKIASEEYNHLLKSVNIARNLSVPLETELSKLEGDLARVKKLIQNHEKIHKRWANERTGLKSKISELKKEEKIIRKKAVGIGAPKDLRPSGTTAQLSTKIQNIKRKFAEKSGVEDGDALEEDLVQHKKRIDQDKKRLDDSQAYIKQLDTMNHDRNTNYMYIRNTVTNMIQRRFATISGTFRKQIGTDVYIKLDHKRRELNFIFKNADGDTMATEIQSLSGGEKSYAQMCLISSLWEHMNPPFRALVSYSLNILIQFGSTLTLLIGRVGRVPRRHQQEGHLQPSHELWPKKDGESVSVHFPPGCGGHQARCGGHTQSLNSRDTEVLRKSTKI